MAEKSESHSSYPNQDSDCEQSAESAAREQKLMSITSFVPNKMSLKLNDGKESLQKFKIPTVARQFLTLSFLIHALSSAVVLSSAAFFTIIPADLAKDRGLNPSSAVYVLQAFSAADIASKAVTGVAIDSCALSHDSVMIAGYVVQVLAYEWLVWVNTFPHLMAASVLMGAAYGSRWCLQAPILVRDFGITALPVTMGGVLFSGGVALLLRPLIIGCFRDTHGDYTGLLHLMAILNAFFVCVWTFKFIASTRTRNAATSQPAHNQNLMSSSKHKNDFK